MRTLLHSLTAVGLLLLTADRALPQILPDPGRPDPPAPESEVQEPGIPGPDARPGQFEFQGYDFGQVVQAMETSVQPLQEELDQSFKVFIDSVQEAEQLLDEGQTHEAVQKAASAIDGVLAVRDKVLGPMWDGQQALTIQTARVRVRLARAVEAAGKDNTTKLSDRTEATLDGIARRIAQERDPQRKKRLVAHYRTIRNLARIKAMAQQLSPDQRKLWAGVLGVLDEATLAHEQVLIGTEVLFAQFDVTSQTLKEYLSLMETVEGASRLLGVVRGTNGAEGGMGAFAQSMQQLQERLAGFNESVETALQGRMFELEGLIDAVEPLDPQGAELPLEQDDELSTRLKRLGESEPAQEPANTP